MCHVIHYRKRGCDNGCLFFLSFFLLLTGQTSQKDETGIRNVTQGRGQSIHKKKKKRLVITGSNSIKETAIHIYMLGGGDSERSCHMP